MSGTIGHRIVTSGLVMHLDAANIKSYPGSGAAWTDLSGKENNGTISNTTFDSSNGGNIVFNGNNSFVQRETTASLAITTLTVSVWVKSTNNSTTYQQGIVSKANLNGNEFGWILRKGQLPSTGINTNKFYFSINTGTYTRRDIVTCSNSEYTDSSFHNVVGRADGVGQVNNIFIDGVKQTGSLTGYTVDITASPQPIMIGRCYGDLLYYAGYESIFAGNIALVKIYNTALSDTQILQNFNANKGRFGL